MKNKKTAIIVSSLIGAFAITFSILSFIPFTKSNPDKSLSSWMSSIDDSRSLNAISIPGTHDSAATHSLLDIAGKCQDLSISQQLEAGARFLDFRLVNYKGSLCLYHGSINQNLSFADSLKSLYSFLEDHPSETILLSIKEEDDAKGDTSSFESLLQKEIKKNSSYWITDSTYPSNLGKARGKIILLSRYSSSTIGVPLYEGWKDSLSKGTSNTFDISSTHIQDYYKVNDVTNKENEISSAYTYSLANPTSLTLNFLSGYLEKGFPPSYSVTVAKSINPWVKDIKEGCGVSIMDFFSGDYGKLIVGWNHD
jgi:1-phosphatidylinositol phosphodiesterase